MNPTPIQTDELQRAVDNDELVLYYQPKVDMICGRIIGAEALVRWDTPASADIVSPSHFLPLAEQSGMLHDITLRLLDQLFAASLILQERHPEFALSINVAPDDLASRMISRRIEQYLDRGVIRSTHLQIEITETQAMNRFEAIAADIEKLHALGIAVLMDDFGTGHSSIDRLSQLPVSALKLDQGVVRRMMNSNHNLNVVKATISMARELDMRSVAEGVESAAGYDILMANGCEEAQGFFIARPMALPDMLDFLAGDPVFHGSQLGRVHQAVYNLIHYRKCLLDAVLCGKRQHAPLPEAIAWPDVSERADDSRIGRWYYSAAPQLESLHAWQALEAPLLSLYQSGQALLEAVRQNQQHVDWDSQLVQFDQNYHTLMGLLRSLERELLLRE